MREVVGDRTQLQRIEELEEKVKTQGILIAALQKKMDLIIPDGKRHKPVTIRGGSCPVNLL